MSTLPFDQPSIAKKPLNEISGGSRNDPSHVNSTSLYSSPSWSSSFPSWSSSSPLSQAKLLTDGFENRATVDFGAGGEDGWVVALKTISTLISLNLRNQNIQAESAMRLADALVANSTLTCLDLSRNDIQAEGLFEIIEV